MTRSEIKKEILCVLRQKNAQPDDRSFGRAGCMANMLATVFSGLLFATASAHADPSDWDKNNQTASGSVESDGPVLLNAALFSLAPASAQVSTSDIAMTTATGIQQIATAAPADKLSGVLKEAHTMIGIPYSWGGNTPEEGLDCSGFVRYVYGRAAGIMLPRLSSQISRKGKPVAEANLHPGDLVFFNTRRGTATHVGIYVGDNQFIHAPKTGSFIRVESMRSAYWTARYYGARRMVA